jgi:para-nitrobenzyl esterase
VIAGSNRDELTLWLGLHRYFMSVSYPFTPLLPPVVRVKNPELYQFWVETRSHAWKLRGVDDALDALHKAGYDSLYAYRFDWDDQQASWFADFPAFMGASHGIEIAFLTGDYKYGPISDYIYPPSIARDQMEATMMSVWADFARSSNPAMGLSNSWLQYTQNQRYFLRLDKDLDLGLESERDDMDSLLLKIANTDVASELEKCIIAWESLINVGDPEIARYQAWDDRRCAIYDIVYEQQRIADELREAHGSVAIF